MNRRLALAFSTALAAAAALAPLGARAGAQAEEALAPSVATVLSRAISDVADRSLRITIEDWLLSLLERTSTQGGGRLIN